MLVSKNGIYRDIEEVRAVEFKEKGYLVCEEVNAKSNKEKKETIKTDKE